MRRALAATLMLHAWMSVEAAPAAEVAVPVEIHGGRQAILVKLDVNGRERTFLVDTGAARTVVDSRVLGVFEFDLKLSRFRRTGPGLSGEAVDAEIETLRLGDIVWRGRRIVVMNLEGLTPVYGRRIDGLLGQDILREFDRVAFDFKSLRMVLSR